MAKKPRVYYSPTGDSMPKRMGDYVPGEGYKTASVREGSNVDISNAMNSYKPVSRSCRDDGYYADMLTGKAPWDGHDEGFCKNAAAEQLINAGCKPIGRVFTDDDATQKQIVNQHKYGRRVYVNVVEGSNGAPTVYDLWMDASNGNDFKYNKVASPTQQGGVAQKVKRNIIPKGTTKLAWDRAQELGFLNGMEYLGFNQYKEASAGKDPDGIWWKKSYTDKETGETKYYLVKENGVENGVDMGGKQVKAVTSSPKKEERKVATKVVKTNVKVASKVPIKKASVGSEREDAKDTPASKSVGVKNKIINLEKGDWKKEISEYIKAIEKSGINPIKMEVKIVDWVLNDFFSLNEDADDANIDD